MTEPRESQPSDRMTTGEFRAAPDISANTAQFQAFAASQRGQTAQFAAVTSPGHSRTRLALLIAAVIVVVAIIAVVAVTIA